MPEIIIENEKIVYNISCKLWNKKQDIIECIKHIPETKTTSLEKYKYYVEYNNTKEKITANKQYFEQIVNNLEI